MVLLKYLADFLTCSRILISGLLAWIGWSQGAYGLQLASILMLASWTSDVLDGSLARRSRMLYSTWIGNHDLYFDLAVAAGLLIFLTASNFINPSISIIYFLCWIFLFSRFGILSALGKLFQVPIYGWFIIVTFQSEPLFAWLMMIFLLLVVIFTWPRFPQDTVPSFVTGYDNKLDSGEDRGIGKLLKLLLKSIHGDKLYQQNFSAEDWRYCDRYCEFGSNYPP
jgi:cardiolipin synthase